MKNSTPKPTDMPEQNAILLVKSIRWKLLHISMKSLWSMQKAMMTPQQIKKMVTISDRMAIFMVDVWTNIPKRKKTQRYH
jgi:hypothetical protein